MFVPLGGVKRQHLLTLWPKRRWLPGHGKPFPLKAAGYFAEENGVGVVGSYSASRLDVQDDLAGKFKGRRAVRKAFRRVVSSRSRTWCGATEGKRAGGGGER